jgi:ABC-type multidrug transport system fused ATPase/permease subunit
MGDEPSPSKKDVASSPATQAGDLMLRRSSSGYGIAFGEVNSVDVVVDKVSVKVNPSTSGWRILNPKKSSIDLESGPPSKTLLDSVSASIPSGSLTAIIGSSGSGKTTL